MKIIISGANGFLGSHLLRSLSSIDGCDVIKFTRDDECSYLFEHLQTADVFFHLAGVNRPRNDKNEYHLSNVQLTNNIVEFIKKNSLKLPVISHHLFTLDQIVSTVSVNWLLKIYY